MAIWKVETQMKKDETPRKRASVRYQWMYSTDDVCYQIYVRNKAYEKLGKPDVIKVTIEAVQ